MCVLLPEVKQSAFPEVSFSNMSNIHGCLGVIQKALSCLDHQQRIITPLARLSDNGDYGVSLWNVLAIWSHILWIHMQTHMYVVMQHMYVYVV